MREGAVTRRHTLTRLACRLPRHVLLRVTFFRMSGERGGEGHVFKIAGKIYCILILRIRAFFPLE